jgi:hypothetical protein
MGVPDGRGSMSKRSLLTLFVSAILVAGTAALAQEDDKMYSGAMCQARIESDTALVRDIFTGGIFNESEEIRQTLLCPIVRDIIAGGAFEYANIIVCIDEDKITEVPDRADLLLPDPVTRPICQLVSNRRTGDPVDLEVDRPNELAPGVFAPNRASFAPITQDIVEPICEADKELILLEFARNSSNIESFRAGYYFFRCFLEFQEGVISYRILEND